MMFNRQLQNDTKDFNRLDAYIEIRYFVFKYTNIILCRKCVCSFYVCGFSCLCVHHITCNGLIHMNYFLVFELKVIAHVEFKWMKMNQNYNMRM